MIKFISYIIEFHLNTCILNKHLAYSITVNEDADCYKEKRMKKFDVKEFISESLVILGISAFLIWIFMYGTSESMW